VTDDCEVRADNRIDAAGKHALPVWFGVGAPRNMPTKIVDKLNQEINAGLADPKIKARFANLGAVVAPERPDRSRASVSCDELTG
jgi:tripartite-type tricarboxylate transporter receptor subunit TctC